MLGPIVAIVAVVAWGLTGPASAAAPDPLFQSAAPLEITLLAPFGDINRERDKDKRYPGTLAYRDESGVELQFDVNLEVRGNWRLREDNCRYVQLWVDFKRSQTPGTLFANQNRLKLVVQCQQRRQFAEYIAKEHQAYLMFAALSEFAFATRLVNIHYQDVEAPNRDRTHIGFFIEHQNRLQERVGLNEVKLNHVARQELDAEQSSLVALFMFMLGNTDYSMIAGAAGDECCHNTKLLVDAAGRYYPIPYDFDASGFVDAEYAPVPNPAYGVVTNRDRAYRGYCVPSAAQSATLQRFQSQRDVLYRILSDTSHMRTSAARRSQRYVDSFFRILDDERELDRRVISQCRN